jgi:hypothetical protein
MMTCPRSERLVALLHDGELDGPLRREMMSHIVGCVVCTRALVTVERIQELMFQAVSDQVEAIDFSHFWDAVENKITQQAPLSWGIQLRLWFERWKLAWFPSVPVWATAAIIIFLTTVFFSRTDSPPTSASTPQKTPPPVLVARANDQAQIESLSTTGTVFLWNEPENNATVIWVSDENDGGMP